ncbi:MAG: hypothetical protein JXO48_07720 [Deltaproteobacteria bacterium]|nr:hypothetical protein [Deltaproteobacteria bacterium]
MTSMDVSEREYTEHQIRERIKELQAFYNLSELVAREDISLDELFQEYANILPRSWQYPAIACARIKVDGSEFRSDNFRESEWILSEPLKVHGSVAGKIEVAYLEEMPDSDVGPFLKEERQLLKAIAERLGHIIERKRGEEEVRKLLSEKELLLREVHHRIKNNMSTVMGMLSLQADALNDPSCASSLADARSRIQSMMVLYDRLYRSSDFRAISTEEYIASLIDEIVGNFPNHRSVRIEKRIDDRVLDAKTLSPVGIILNELLTNAMKHAFAGREEGLIGVTFSFRDGHAILDIYDDGVGIPEDFDIKASTGFGMQLVDMLTEQLGGTLRVERRQGTRFIIEFDV